MAQAVLCEILNLCFLNDTIKPLTRIIEIFSVLGLVNPSVMRTTRLQRLISLETRLVHWNLTVAAILGLFQLNAFPLE